MLAEREAQATTAERWLSAFRAAADAGDADAGAEILKQGVDALPAAGMGHMLKGIAERAIAQRANARAYRAALEEGSRTAEVYVVECRRHVVHRQ